MIKTMIVDDEIWVSRLIESLVDWKAMGFELVGIADNGQLAYDMILEKHPDLVVTDIRMPGFSGLSLIEKTKKLFPDTVFVVISGYSDFAYARQALENGVFSYLLKPIDETELKNMLVRVKKSIEQRTDQELESNMVKERLQQSLAHLKEEYFRKLLLREHAAGRTPDEVCREFEMKLASGKYRVIAYRASHQRGISADMLGTDETLRKNILNIVYDSLPEVFCGDCYDMVNIMIGNQVVAVLNYGDDKAQAIWESVRDSYERILEKVHMHGGYQLTIGMGSETGEFEKLPDSYETSQIALRSRIYHLDTNIIDNSGDVYAQKQLEEILTFDVRNGIIQQMEVLDAEAITEIVRRVMNPARMLHPDLVFKLAENIVDLLFSVLRKRRSREEIEGISQASLLRAINESRSVEEIVSYLEEFVSVVKNFYSNSQKDQQKRTVDQIKLFIHQHYMENIGLEDICNTVYLSSKYASSLFKQEAGTTIMEYLTDYRLNMAKELLLDKKYRMTDVVQLVGYNDVRYFSKVFKKKIGVNPTEYRKLFI